MATKFKPKSGLSDLKHQLSGVELSIGLEFYKSTGDDIKRKISRCIVVGSYYMSVSNYDTTKPPQSKERYIWENNKIYQILEIPQDGSDGHMYTMKQKDFKLDIDNDSKYLPQFREYMIE